MQRAASPLWGGLLTTAALCACAPLSLNVGPVPITLQSLIICLAGALAGGAGVLGVAFWLALAALGLPVLAGVKGGVAAMGGYSAGFLIALPIAARLAMRWRPSWGWRRTMGLMLACHGLLLALGGLGVVLRGGDPAALAVLLPGAAVKSLAATVLLLAATRFAPARTGKASGAQN
jgi:biotin transport system substrate-specific component